MLLVNVSKYSTISTNKALAPCVFNNYSDFQVLSTGSGAGSVNVSNYDYAICFQNQTITLTFS